VGDGAGHVAQLFLVAFEPLALSLDVGHVLHEQRPPELRPADGEPLARDAVGPGVAARVRDVDEGRALLAVRVRDVRRDVREVARALRERGEQLGRPLVVVAEAAVGAEDEDAAGGALDERSRRGPLDREEGVLHEVDRPNREDGDAERLVAQLREDARRRAGDRVRNDGQTGRREQTDQRPRGGLRLPKEPVQQVEAEDRQDVREGERRPVEASFVDDEAADRLGPERDGEVAAVDRVGELQRDDGDVGREPGQPVRRPAVVVAAGVRGGEVQPRERGGEADGQREDVQRDGRRLLARDQHARLKEPPRPRERQEPPEAAPGVGVPEARTVERGRETGQSREPEQPDEPPRYRHELWATDGTCPLSSIADTGVKKTVD